MSIKIPGASPTVASTATTSTADDISPEGQAQIQQLQSERAQLEAEMILSKEDEFAKIERLHQNRLATLPAIGSKSPTANVGKGPQAGDPGVGKVAEFVPITLKG
jgi:hypothetical protein